VAADDTLFFSRLRNHAKWMFVFLAVTFAASFVLFGVGTGFGGLQDILVQNQGVAGGPSENSAREQIAENPKDAQAYRDLATALQNQQKPEESIAPLAKYVELKPSDVDSQRELAALYLQQGSKYRTEAQLAQIGLQNDVPGTIFKPSSTSKIGQALSTDPITEALSSRYNTALNEAFSKMTTAFTNAVAAYKVVAKAQPNDSAIQFELAQTAEAANDLPTAIAAYKRFLKLAPEDQSAPAVKEHIKQLEASIAPAPEG
jgi:regulator of sirC expression with transglutaminase-like and TPR domain